MIALGATRVPGEGERGFRVIHRPRGHPFCIVFGLAQPKTLNQASALATGRARRAWTVIRAGLG